jgi:hypothetical protein
MSAADTAVDALSARLPPPPLGAAASTAAGEAAAAGAAAAEAAAGSDGSGAVPLSALGLRLPLQGLSCHPYRSLSAEQRMAAVPQLWQGLREASSWRHIVVRSMGAGCPFGSGLLLCLQGGPSGRVVGWTTVDLVQSSRKAEAIKEAMAEASDPATQALLQRLRSVHTPDADRMVVIDLLMSFEQRGRGVGRCMVEHLKRHGLAEAPTDDAAGALPQSRRTRWQVVANRSYHDDELCRKLGVPRYYTQGVEIN